ncbi:hypothetical protein NECAME_03778 [Necator americanus]|uniref:Uncharacterized protein n=1 Tax=Necator americanus TaxID=51031 RepID=W2T2F1_NECAM|nr:hypothetical protein NECAME_03778 [Necator americanus]ETN75396.1 hypothetical protein NECAME_03778 [Necator americanus]
MGGYLSSSSTDSSPTYFDLYAELEKTRIERQLAIQQLLEHRRRAYKLAEEREKLKWSASGGGVMMIFCLFSWFHHKNMLHLLPIFPTLSYLGYETHYCYGNKAALIDRVANQIREENIDELVPNTISVQDMGQTTSQRVPEQRAAELKLLNDDFIEAEIMLKNLQFAQERATKFVRLQDLFTFEFGAAATVTCILVAAGAIYKRKDFAIPIAPLIMGLGYRYDNAFGEKHEVVREHAETLLKANDERLKVVGGPLTLKEVDAYRERHFQ